MTDELAIDFIVRSEWQIWATAFALAQTLRKTPVRAGVCDGFIGNRILAVYKQAADYLMEDGASPYEIDAAVRAFGYPMGPFQVTDLAGGDIGWAMRKRRRSAALAAGTPPGRYVEVADRICERGWFGQKTGRGFYLYPQGTRTGLGALVLAARQRTTGLGVWIWLASAGFGASLILFALSRRFWLSCLLLLIDSVGGFFCFNSIPLGAAGVALGIIARGEIRSRDPRGSTALATGGMVCSIIGLWSSPTGTWLV